MESIQFPYRASIRCIYSVWARSYPNVLPSKIQLLSLWPRTGPHWLPYRICSYSKLDPHRRRSAVIFWPCHIDLSSNDSPPWCPRKSALFVVAKGAWNEIIIVSVDAQYFYHLVQELTWPCKILSNTNIRGYFFTRSKYLFTEGSSWGSRI